MKLTKYRLFMAWEHEKEEVWLGEMESQGWHLEAVQAVRYTFVKGEPEQYQYRLEMLPELPGHPRSKEYLDFMEEMGVEVIASYLRWVYFRKKNDGTPFEIYSDNASRLRHLQRIQQLLSAALCIEIGAILILSSNSGLWLARLIPAALTCALAYGIVQTRRRIQQLEAETTISE